MKLYIESQKSQLDIYGMGNTWLYSTTHISMNPSNHTEHVLCAKYLEECTDFVDNKHCLS